MLLTLPLTTARDFTSWRLENARFPMTVAVSVESTPAAMQPRREVVGESEASQQAVDDSGLCQ